MKIKLFILTSIFVSILLPFFFFNSFSKYLFDDTFLVAKVQIDNSAPEIELISFSNSNTTYPSYANKTHTITAKIKVIEEHIKEINFDISHIKVKVGNNFVPIKLTKISYTQPNSKERIYEISFTNIPSDGILNLCFLENSVVDKSSQGNSPTNFVANIMIDNTAPVLTFSEESINDGFSNCTITANEYIQPVLGWNLSANNKYLTCKFANPIEYLLPIKDFAQNSASILVSVKSASSIGFKYGILDGGTNIIQIVDSGEISGNSLITSNSIFKAEALFVKTSGNIDSSLLRGKAFLYTYYGEGSSGSCFYSELPYNYGYNPKNSFRIVNKENLSNAAGDVNFTQFGGAGVNYSTGKFNSIPENLAKQHLFGLSSIAFSLSDYSQYSIVYQIYVKDIGWLPVKYNGEETMYRFDKPFCGIRMNLVPNNHRQYLVDYWNSNC